MTTNFRSMENDTTMQPLQASTSQGLILQSYCNSVLTQPHVNFGDYGNLKKFQQQVNDSLDKAKGNADTYLTKIQTGILENISMIDNYYTLHATVPTVCPPETTEKEWLSVLEGLQEQAEAYKETCKGTVNTLITFDEKLARNAEAFTQTVSLLNNTVGGDNGTLIAMQKDLSKLDSKISGCIAGTVLSAFAIVGGAFMIAVGGIADFVTAGTSTPLVIGGVAVLLTGVGVETGSAVALAGLYKQKESLLIDQASLKSEVQFANGIKTAYDNLSSAASNALDASLKMSNAWELLGDDLDMMARNLHSGILSTEYLRKMFLTAASSSIPHLKTDIDIIKGQMTGVNVHTVKDTSLAEFIMQRVHAA